MVLNGEERLECDIYVDRIRLEHVSECKYFWGVLDESVTDRVECSRKVMSGRRVAGAIRSLVMLGICSLSVLESYMKLFLYLFLCMGVRQCEKERSRIMTVHTDNLRGLLGIRRMDRIPNGLIREFLRSDE